MIKANIALHYSHHLVNLQNFSDNIYIADYTEMTKTFQVKRNVEFFSPVNPTDINYFSVNNIHNLNINGVKFDQFSFVCGNGNTRTQCEAVLFPGNSQSDSWVLFCELKYSIKPLRNTYNLEKAIKQLYKTRYYYIQNKVIESTNISYLIASIPCQSEPFANFSISPNMLIKLKNSRNIILRLKNSVDILNDKMISV